MHILCNGFKENEINCTLLQGTVTNGKNSDQTSTFVMLRKGFKSCILVLLLIFGAIGFSDALFHIRPAIVPSYHSNYYLHSK
ncbi:hypothetical protein SB30_270276 [Klebsiella quasipneumoniae subsp. similipneumoniae]|nr:hypothetical protein SB30_270276 [Klebsiella quasipneumoniae subsp. similipneumoniae]